MEAGASSAKGERTDGRDASRGSRANVRSWPVTSPASTDASVTSPSSTSVTGDPWRSLLKGVAYAGPPHDDGAASGAAESAQVRLLQGRLVVRPADRAASRWQRGCRLPRCRVLLAVQVVDDAAALLGDRRQCGRLLDGGEGLHLEAPDQGDGGEHRCHLSDRHDHRHSPLVTDDQGSGDREDQHPDGESVPDLYSSAISLFHRPAGGRRAAGQATCGHLGIAAAA